MIKPDFIDMQKWLVENEHRCHVPHNRPRAVCPFVARNCAFDRYHILCLGLRAFLPRRVQVCVKDGTMLRRLILGVNLLTHSKIRPKTVSPKMSHFVIDLEKGGIR